MGQRKRRARSGLVVSDLLLGEDHRRLASQFLCLSAASFFERNDRERQPAIGGPAFLAEFGMDLQ
jgi:hypothetical protein